jgi:hypothetical protein
MTPDEFQRLWIRPHFELVTFPPDKVVSLRIPDASKSFLISPGIPRSAAPFIDFGSRRDLELPKVSEAWLQSKEFERYRIIGSNGFGDPICVDEEAHGRVVYLNHDNEFEVGFMNSSVPQLAYSALAFREVAEKTRAKYGKDAFLKGQIPIEAVDEFITKMDAIDLPAIADGSFWFRSILGEGI